MEKFIKIWNFIWNDLFIICITLGLWCMVIGGFSGKIIITNNHLLLAIVCATIYLQDKIKVNKS